MNIQFLPMNQRVDVEPGSNLLQLALDHGININGICQGKGTCGKCKVLITKGNPREYTAEEMKHLTSEERSKGTHLACAMNVKQDTCVIIPRESQIEDKKIVVKSNQGQDLTNKDGDSYGMVFDIGTTSVEAALYNLVSGKEIVRFTKNNPQSSYGADVISRISYCNQKEENIYKLKKMIIDCCNEMIHEIIDNNWVVYSEIRKGIGYNNIYKCVFLANTTMSHIFLGKSVKGLSKAPFSPVYTGMISWINERAEFYMNNQGEIIMLPGLSGQVGSDTLGCILTTDLIHKDGISLIIDIGTNSEVVLGDNGRLVCCSSAAGPAFEGASISQGMRATIGGIKGARIYKDQLELDIVGDGTPIGICGSGIIDIIGELVQEGIIDETGRIVSPTETTSLLRDRIIQGEGNDFLLSSPWSRDVVKITQKDIREVQMAKAAIYAGIMTLLEEKGISLSQIDQVYLAGAFGNNINIRNAIRIGLLPDIPIEKFAFIGNGSLEGGALFLLSQIAEDEVIKISKDIEHIELANNSNFRDLFIHSMNFK